MTIHATHPFADPEPDPVRRFRGRVGGTVSLWTAGEGTARAGLTVTSFLVAAGEEARVLALLDPDADLTERLLATGRGVVQLLSWEDRDLAEMFAGNAPAPGGTFRQATFEQTAWGPRLASAAHLGRRTARGGRRGRMVAAGDHRRRAPRGRRATPSRCGTAVDASSVRVRACPTGRMSGRSG